MKRFAQRRNPMLKAVQAKRTSAEMRRRNSHERQAEDVAHRFVAGEIGLSRFLTPAPAAGFTLPSSPGEPLATGIRAELEHAFDADLSAVRIHRDQGAANAAAAIHARAFTSGAHLYFAAGEYSPDSRGGRQLLAHEIAHGIQQTARVSSKGTVLDSHAGGTGRVQCATPYETELAAAMRLDQEFWRCLTFDNIVSVHLAYAENRDDFYALCEEVATDLGLGDKSRWSDKGWSSPVSSHMTAFSARFKGYAEKYPRQFGRGQRPGYGLLYDCLKRLGQFSAAFDLLRAHSSLLTLTMHSAMMLQLNGDAGLNLLTRSSVERSILRPFIRDLPVRVTAMLLAPGRGFFPHQLRHGGRKKTLEEAFATIRDNAGSTTQGGENELEGLVWITIAGIEADLHKTLLKPPVGAQGRPELRLLFAEEVLAYAVRLQQGSSNRCGLIADTIRREAGREIEVASQRVVELWRFALDQAPQDARMGETMGADPFVAKIASRVATAGRLFLRVGRDGQLPDSPAYRARCRQLRDQILALVNSELEPALLKLARRSPGDLSGHGAHGLAWLMRWFYDAAAEADSFNLEQDRSFESRWKRDDVRASHRVGVALQLQALGEFVAASELSLLARSAAQGLDRPIQGNQLFLIGDWEPDTETEWESIGQEVPGRMRSLTGISPFSGQSFALLFRLSLLSSRAAAMQQLLNKGAGQSREPFHRQVNRMLASMELPKRWFVRNALFSVAPQLLSGEAATRLKVAPGTRVDQLTDPQRKGLGSSEMRYPAGQEPGALVLDHPKTLAQLIPRVPLSAGWFLMVPETVTASVYAWMIPPVEGLIDMLRQIEPFNRAVLRAAVIKRGGAQPRSLSESLDEAQRKALSELEVEAENAARWVEMLNNGQWAEFLEIALGEPLVAGARGTRVPLLGETEALFIIHGEAEQRYGVTEARYVALLKQASGRHRRSLVAEQLLKLNADDNSLEVRHTFARNAVAALEGFRADAFPHLRLKSDPSIQATIDIQLALGMLELATAVNRRIENESDDRLIVDCLRLTDNALKFLDKRDEWLARAAVRDVAELLAPGESADALYAQRTAVAALHDRLKAGRSKIQLTRGFRGQRASGASFSGLNAALNLLKAVVPGSGYSLRDLSAAVKAGKDRDAEFLNGVKPSWQISPGDEFTISGNEYLLIEVHRPFVYFPSFSGPTSRSFRMNSDAAYAPPIILDGYLSSVGDDIQKTLPPITDDQPLLSVLHNGRVMTLSRPKNDGSAEDLRTIGFLDHFAHAVTMQSYVIGLEKLSEGIEFFGELMMEVSALFFGPFGSAAKTGIDMLQFASSDEMSDMAELLQRDPVRFVREVYQQLADDFLQPETFLKVMLFPDSGAADVAFGRLERLGMGGRKKEPARPGTLTRPKRPLGRVIMALVNLGKHLAGSLARLHKRMEVPMGGLRSRVGMHPMLAQALTMIAVYGPIVLTTAKAISDEYQLLKKRTDSEGQQAASSMEGVAGMVVAGLKDGSATLSEEIDSIMANLASLEIPGTVVPLVDLVSMIGDLAIRVLARSGKAKIADKLAHATGVKQEVYQKTATAISGTAFDPNQHWKEKVIPLIQGRFDEIRNSFVKALGEGLTTAAAAFNEIVPAGLRAQGVTITILSTSKVRPETFDGNFAEFVPYQEREQYDQERSMPPLRAEGMGSPLPSSLRESAENRFKHDFGHVRIHDGAEGQRATRPARALALTSGSHVWVDPLVSLDSEQGQGVLDHELAHVLQQTGPRPLGGRHGQAPVKRRGSRGVVVDPPGERGAECIARQVRQGVDTPVVVEGEGVDGFAPLGSDLVFNFLDMLTSYRDTTAFQSTIDKAMKGGKPPAKVPGLDVARGLWLQVKTLLAKEESYSPTFRATVRGDIHAHLQKADADIVRAIPYVAQDTQTPDREAMAKKTARQKKSGRKKTIVQQVWMLDPKPFITLLAGYVFTKCGVAIDVTLDMADRKKPRVKKVLVQYLNLGRFPPASPLWGKLKNKLNETDRREMATRLSVLDPLPGVWDAGDYRLDSDYIKRYERWRERRKGYGRPPTAREYVDGVSGNTLTIGTHAHLTSRRDNTTERESHHTTQFLLIQYFSNSHTRRKPFFKGLPGVQWEGETAIRFKATGRRAIEIGPLFEGDRGGPMPAILLSRETHRQGRLHIDRGAQWDPESPVSDKSGSMTQAYMLDGQYRSRLAAEGVGDAADEKSFITNRSSLGDVKAIELGIFKAMTGTCAWMQDVMSTALRNALPRNECAFYRGWVSRHDDLVQGGKPRDEYDLKPPTLEMKVFSAALKNDRDVMGKYGWIT